MIHFRTTFQTPDMDASEIADARYFDFEDEALRSIARARAQIDLSDVRTGLEVTHTSSTRFVTFAPADYDGFGTRWVASVYDPVNMTTDRGRIVDIQRRHRLWQEGRYRSGGYFLDPVAFYEPIYRDDDDPAWAPSFSLAL